VRRQSSGLVNDKDAIHEGTGAIEQFCNRILRQLGNLGSGDRVQGLSMS
jgi:hypothetical protein